MTNNLLVPGTHSGRVVISENIRPISYYGKDGVAINAGQFISRVYEGENVQRHAFQALPRANQAARLYKLGPTTSKFQFVNHTDVIDPFLERGYNIHKVTPIRGGLQVLTELHPATPTYFQDMVHWDDRLWEGMAHLREHSLHDSVAVITATRPKKSLSIRRGYFRLICTNGMMVSILDLGSLRMSHANYSAIKTNSFLDSTDPIVIERGNDTVRRMGPWVGTRKGAERLADMITNHMLPGMGHVVTQDDDDIDDGEDEDTGSSEVVSEDDYLNSVPYFIRGQVKPLTRMPRWYLSSLALNLRHMAEYNSEDKVYAFDLVTAITNPVNLAAAGTATARPLWTQEPLTRSLTNILGGLSLS